jgi:hypothetical protein
MTAENKTYAALVQTLLADPRIVEGNLFGVRVVKIGGKPFVGLFQNKQLVVKVGAPRVQEMIRTKGGQAFDPSGRNHPMKDWIAINEPAANARKKWLELAAEAKAFVDQE